MYETPQENASMMTKKVMTNMQTSCMQTKHINLSFFCVSPLIVVIFFLLFLSDNPSPLNHSAGNCHFMLNNSYFSSWDRILSPRKQKCSVVLELSCLCTFCVFKSLSFIFPPVFIHIMHMQIQPPVFTFFKISDKINVFFYGP